MSNGKIVEFQLLNSPRWKRSTDFVDKVPTVSGFCSDNFHGSYQVWINFIFPIRCSYQTKSPLHLLSFPNSGNSSTSEVALPPNLTDKASSNGLDVLGPCMDLSVHVPNGYITVIFNWLLSWKQIVQFPMDPNIYCLCIGVEANFYGWCNTMRQVDGTTQEFCGWYFQLCKFQLCLLAKYFISVKNCSCSDHT